MFVENRSEFLGYNNTLYIYRNLIPNKSKMIMIDAADQAKLLLSIKMASTKTQKFIKKNGRQQSIGA